MSRHDPNRRQWFARTAFLAGAGLVATSTRDARAADAAPIALGTRRELFVDDFLIDRLEGKAERRLQHPTPRELVLVHDAPWEGSGSGYHSIFKDGDRYRMYYKAWHLDPRQGALRSDAHPLYCCYAESDDGIHWRKPELGLVEFQGSRANNIVVASGPLGPLNVDAGHPAVFRDDNPDASPEGRYKALFRSSKPNGLLPFQSPDGLRWSPMSDRPVITNGAFDSQNLAFWDPNIRAYRAYWRFFTPPGPGRSLRAIRTATSRDLLHWTESTDLAYVDSPAEELYTNQIKPYHRAPHILIGFPTRYVDRGWSPSMEALPELEHRKLRSSSTKRYGTAITEALVMSSRDGQKFERWNDAFLRPGIERPGTWNYGHQYIGWHLVETASSLDGAPPELSLYSSESYWTGNSSALRRYTLRLDGFVSVSAPRSGGELSTRLITFNGSRLHLNFASAVSGSIRVEIQDASGKPVPGHGLDDCDELFGDTVDRPVTWRGQSSLEALRGKPARLRFALRDADLYAFRFGEA